MEIPKVTVNQHRNREPVTVEIGGEEFTMDPRPYRESRRWLAKALRAIVAHGLGDVFMGKLDEQKIEERSAEMIDAMPTLVDLAFEYAGWDSETCARIDGLISSDEEAMKLFSVALQLGNLNGASMKSENAAAASNGAIDSAASEPSNGAMTG